MSLIVVISYFVVETYMLKTDREVVRNEALILLVGLSRDNVIMSHGENDDGVQKLMVFGGIFEKLIYLFLSETGISEDSNLDDMDEEHREYSGVSNEISNSVVVGDSIELLNNLLRNNVSNQTLFRESMHLKNVTLLLGVRNINASINFGKMAKQQRWNLLCALELVSLLTKASTQEIGLSSPSSDPKNMIYNSSTQNRTSNQDVLLENGVLQILISLALEGAVASVAIRSVALTALGDMINSNANTNTAFEKARVLGVEPALNAILRLIIKSNNTGEVEAAMHVMRCYLNNNR